MICGRWSTRMLNRNHLEAIQRWLGSGKHLDERTKRHKAMSCIQNSVSDVIFTRIMACESPKQAWDKLQEEFQGQRGQGATILEFEERFENLKMKEEESCQDSGESNSNSAERYEAKSHLSRTQGSSTISPDRVDQCSICSSARRASRRKSIKKVPFEQGQIAYKGKKAWRDKPKNDLCEREGQTCKHRRRVGHPEEKCWFNPDLVCQDCKKKGHVERVCKSKTKSRQNRSQQMKAEARVAKEDKDQEEQVFLCVMLTARKALIRLAPRRWMHQSHDTDLAIFKSLDETVEPKSKLLNSLEKGYSVVFKDKRLQIGDPSGSKPMAIPMVIRALWLMDKEVDIAYTPTSMNLSCGIKGGTCQLRIDGPNGREDW
ncbi:uncharacterized protein LOC128034887 [Gossypium raimondii]|uniref:uncharacterized protein LOC128034887 n=1 Tax=Gossypium raimondii TaxID=29730 RepID=UPI00227B5497|nr:uncharacterized protein LOC128034887 [Gossypium raimondii]